MIAAPHYFQDFFLAKYISISVTQSIPRSGVSPHQSNSFCISSMERDQTPVHDKEISYCNPAAQCTSDDS